MLKSDAPYPPGPRLTTLPSRAGVARGSPPLHLDDTPAKGWLVIVVDDPVNLIACVAAVLRKVFSYDPDEAMRVTMQVHSEGRSVVWKGDKAKAEAYCVALGSAKLSTRLSEDS